MVCMGWGEGVRAECEGVRWCVWGGARVCGQCGGCGTSSRGGHVISSVTIQSSQASGEATGEISSGPLLLLPVSILSPHGHSYLGLQGTGDVEGRDKMLVFRICLI